MCSGLHVYMYTCKHVYMNTCVQVYMHTCIHAYMYTCVHAYMYTCVHVHTCNTCMNASMHFVMFPCMHVFRRICMSVRVHAPERPTTRVGRWKIRLEMVRPSWRKSVFFQDPEPFSNRIFDRSTRVESD